MMISASRRDPNLVRRTVSESKLEWLGQARDGFLYARYGGQEYAVHPGSTSPEDRSLAEGEIFVMRIAHEVVDGTPVEHHRHHLGMPVANGSFVGAKAREQAAAEARERRANPPSRPLDALALHPLLAKRHGAVVQTAPQAIHPITAALSRRVRGIVIPARSQRRGVSAILEILHSKGVGLALTESGSMYAVGPKLTVDVQGLIQAAAPLLHAHLQGHPLRCELKHAENQAPDAASLLVGGAAACQAHLDGELAP